MTWFYRLSIKENHPATLLRQSTFPTGPPVHRAPSPVANGQSSRLPSSNVRFLDPVFLAVLSYFACFVRPMFYFIFFRLINVWPWLLHPSHNGHTQTPATIKSPQIR